jgi:hypothetical protein
MKHSVEVMPVLLLKWEGEECLKESRRQQHRCVAD